ncbi:carbamoyltransferase HypF [Chromobacterium sp. IIBBL 290-4]|uniref:carbamoyltransferase HypF n=1 Tax=Chromobacterium sp. IIBBL 290-4 TaxID=2953890 RepID=UPI0020B709B9|nr:carbamoyltransferase HypF [Chromobacterium sp. IIBBL 290-4]UTH73056.1 carbamoyltransferase HypF [Chromobacterium sp. IIBBL 290-4]
MAREQLTVTGIVQGVGFRPFAYRLAGELDLAGWIRNDGDGVTLELQGGRAELDGFAARLLAEKPPLARIDRIQRRPLPDQTGSSGFAIRQSAQGGSRAAIGADSCVCDACLAELFDPANRRYRYPFINCTDCGPRYTLVSSLPYDRAQTSMAAFGQCPACLQEYSDPRHRRFHAEPNACPDCGPRLTLRDVDGPVRGDPLRETLRRLLAGGIVAIKGLGGFHLACDARNAAAVARLRQRKAREEKPLAVMAANAASLHGMAAPDELSIRMLNSPQRPIVLLPQTAVCEHALRGVAPDSAWLGVMLPYTPLHYLLFHEAAGRPTGLDWLNQPQPLLLVMTSANLHGEPLITDNDAARALLPDLADAVLEHDRDIVTRCDDSVLRVGSQGRAQLLRRGRGYTPNAIALSRGGPSVLALGAHLKNTLCLTRGNEAFLSQHIGDLDRVANCQALEAAAEHLQKLLASQPAYIAHDLHPDYFSTHLAKRWARRLDILALAVQHHHAHIAAILAEHQCEEPVLGLALDGVGLGDDGGAWGGELLLVDGAHFQRLGHLATLALPGGDRAAREPWRMAAAALHSWGEEQAILDRFPDEPAAAQLLRWLNQGKALNRTSSLGRHFDAAAALLGIAARSSFEAQAAMRLEGLAERRGLPRRPPKLHKLDASNVLDLSPLLHRLAEGFCPSEGAALFHACLIEALADWAAVNARRHSLRLVACGGGCLQNAILARGLHLALGKRGLTMLQARQAPAGDGGLALGQAWVAQRHFHR